MDQSTKQQGEHFRKSSARLSNLISAISLEKSKSFYEQLVVEMLNIPDPYRSKQIRESLAEWLDCIEFFGQLRKKHGDQYVKKFYSYLSAEKYKQGQMMIRTGDQSLFFYVILSGAVMVLYPRSKADIEQDCKGLDAVETKKYCLYDRITEREENHRHFKNVPITSITNYQRYFNELGIPIVSVENVLTKGRGFGELGILYRSKRMADIICQQDCIVAKISRDKYLKIVGDQSQKKITERLAFLARYFSPHIGRMARNEAQRYLYLFEEVQWKVNSIIFPIDSPVKGLFIITEGCVVLKTHNVDQTEEMRSIQRFGIFKSNRKKKLVAFKQLGVGQSFGIQQFMKNQKQAGLKYNYQAIASTKSKILFCSLVKLVPILKQDKQLDKQLKTNFAFKEQLSPIHGIKSPEARLFRFSEKISTSRPTYRMSPVLISQKADVIRSPKSQSLHNSRENILLSKICDDYGPIPTTFRKKKSEKPLEQDKQNRSKVMSRALQVCAIENIASAFKKTLKSLRKHRRTTSFDHKVVEKNLDNKYMERRLRHYRKW